MDIPRPHTHSHLHLAFAGFWLLFIPAAAGAQFITTWHISTPFSPPQGYLWVPPIYLAALFGWLWFATRRWGDGRGVAIPIVVLIVMASVVTFAAGALLVALDLISPPGFGFPGAPFHGYGYGWERLGDEFHIGNLAAVLVLVLSAWFVLGKMGVEDLRWRSLTVGGCIAIYLLCLIPYVAARAMIHGRPGAVISSQCQDRLRSAAFTLGSYAEAHDWHLPKMDGSEDLQLQFPGGIVSHCPVEDLLSTDPEPYGWNVDLAGRSILELAEECPDAMVVWCTRDHGGEQYGIRICDLMAAIEIEDGRVRLRPLFR